MPVDKARDGKCRPSALQLNFAFVGAHFFQSLIGHVRCRTQDEGIAITPRNSPWAQASTFATHPQFRLGKQLQQIGARRFQPDFDHTPCHADNGINRAEQGFEPVLAIGGNRAVQAFSDLIAGHFGAVGPLHPVDAKDDAAPVVGDDPALGKRRLDLPVRVECDQTHCSFPH